MDGLPHHRPIFGTSGVPPGAQPGYEPFLSGRYAAAITGGMDPLLRLEIMRRQDHMLAAASAAPPIGNDAVLLARREEELARLNGARDRIVEVELAARDVRDRAAAAHAARAARARAQIHEAYRADSVGRIAALREQRAVRQGRTPSGGAFGGALRRRPAQPSAIAAGEQFLGAALAFGSGGNSSFHDKIQQRLLEKVATTNRQQQAAGPGFGERENPADENLALGFGEREDPSRENLTRHAAEVRHRNARRGGAPQDNVERKGSLAVERGRLHPEGPPSIIPRFRGAARADRAERLLLEGGLLRRGGLFGGISQFRGAAAGADKGPGRGLDVLNQAHVATAPGRTTFSNGLDSPAAVPRASPIQLRQRQRLNSPNEDSGPLRYFKNGVEVNEDGNPISDEKFLAPSPVQSNETVAPTIAAPLAAAPSDAAPSTAAPSAAAPLAGAPPTAAGNLASPNNNIIAKFLAVVVSRVPEIANAVADLLPDGSNPVLLRRKFPVVVDATLSELESMREGLAMKDDAKGADLLRRVNNCVTAIEPYKVDANAAGGFVPVSRPPSGAPPSASAMGMTGRELLPPGALTQSAMMGRGLLPPGALLPPRGMPLPTMAAGMTSQALLEPGIDPLARQQLMLNNPRLHHPITDAVPMPGYFLPPEEMLMMQQAHRHWAAMAQLTAFQAHAFHPNPIDPKLFTPPPVASEGSGSESPLLEDMPMMTAHKAKKREDKRREKVAASKRKKRRKPKLVHHASFKGALDMDGAARKAALAREREARRGRALAEGSESKSEEEGEPAKQLSGAGNVDATEGNEDRTVSKVPAVREGDARTSMEDSDRSVVTQESEDRSVR